MNGLSEFRHFDIDGFLNGKKLAVASVRKWKKFQAEDILGTAVTVAIIEDKTTYKPRQDGSQVNNLYSQFSIKVPTMSVSVQVGDIVEPVNPVGTVYGKFNNELSVRADDVVKVTAPTATGGKN